MDLSGQPDIRRPARWMVRRSRYADSGTMTTMTARSEHDSSPTMPVAKTDGAPTSLLARHFRGTGGALGYLLLGFPLALIAIVGAVVLFSVGISTWVLGIGVPILVGAVLYARGFATVERRLQAQLLGRRPPSPEYAIPSERGLGRLFGRLRDPQAWLDLLWTLPHFVVSTVTFSVALT